MCKFISILPGIILSRVSAFEEFMNERRKLLACLWKLECRRDINGAVDSVYRRGLMAELRGRINTATQAYIWNKVSVFMLKGF